MPTSSAIRLQIESALAQKIPSALTPVPKMIRPVVTTGIVPLDEILKGGLPVGAVIELVGPECSGANFGRAFLPFAYDADSEGVCLD